MPDLDARLRQHLDQPAELDAAMAAFDAMLKRTKLVTIGFVALSVAMIVGGGFMLFERTELRDLIAGAVLILLGGQVQLLVKLWYWQVHGRIAVQRDLRLVLAGMERP